MTEKRKAELLAKIAMVACNDLTAFAGTEKDIEAAWDEQNSGIKIDLIVHYIVRDEDKDDKMIVRYAACNSTIANPSMQYLDKTNNHI